MTISAEGVKIKLAHKDVNFENEIKEYSTTLRRKLLAGLKLNEPIKIKVNYVDNKIVRYKPMSIKYNGDAIRYTMEVR